MCDTSNNEVIKDKNDRCLWSHNVSIPVWGDIQYITNFAVYQKVIMKK